MKKLMKVNFSQLFKGRENRRFNNNPGLEGKGMYSLLIYNSKKFDKTVLI